jgi:signal transduction histidine kinase
MARNSANQDQGEGWRLSEPIRLDDASTVGWLSASIIHDLRNPLATVCAGAEMLLDLDTPPSQAKRLAVNIYHAASRMHDLLMDLTLVAHANQPVAQMCDIGDVVRAASEAALHPGSIQNIKIILNMRGELEVPMIRSRIERVFFNVITNAIEAMSAGGEIRIKVRKAGDYVLIDIEDTGPGIPPRIRERLFTPFVTLGKKNGLGLGLALSRQTVLDHGGDMWTEPAAGARFVVRLPLTTIDAVAHSA